MEEEEDGNAEFSLVVHPEKESNHKGTRISPHNTMQREPLTLKASYNPFA